MRIETVPRLINVVYFNNVLKIVLISYEFIMIIFQEEEEDGRGGSGGRGENIKDILMRLTTTGR